MGKKKAVKASLNTSQRTQILDRSHFLDSLRRKEIYFRRHMDPFSVAWTMTVSDGLSESTSISLNKLFKEELKAKAISDALRLLDLTCDNLRARVLRLVPNAERADAGAVIIPDGSVNKHCLLAYCYTSSDYDENLIDGLSIEIHPGRNREIDLRYRDDLNAEAARAILSDVAVFSAVVRRAISIPE